MIGRWNIKWVAIFRTRPQSSTNSVLPGRHFFSIGLTTTHPTNHMSTTGNAIWDFLRHLLGPRMRPFDIQYINQWAELFGVLGLTRPTPLSGSYWTQSECAECECGFDRQETVQWEAVRWCFNQYRDFTVQSQCRNKAGLSVTRARLELGIKGITWCPSGCLYLLKERGWKGILQDTLHFFLIGSTAFIL